eukprot:CAMPEP_0170179842 /NCGR_PEP_ID=MMETSP0040_2-20121228/19436_1 /TAXON_ID=641309 /ORGANISM="Lotharella oceanica, Strain CCMP622" /LENGTH=280 /DNA_ID=CAMNT_0010424175 /DNA_START=136 /DNA_END=978 /DNA_ORIENTATION=-
MRLKKFLPHHRPQGQNLGENDIIPGFDPFLEKRIEEAKEKGIVLPQNPFKDDDEPMFGKKDGATGQGMVQADRMWLQKREVTDEDLMRAGQFGNHSFTPEFLAEFKYPIGSIVWYKSLTHLNKWIKVMIEGYAGADLDNVRYYNLDIRMSQIKHDPCVRRENVNEAKLRSLEEGIPEGEEEYTGGASVWVNPHIEPPKMRQFRTKPIRIKKDMGQPKTMYWRMGPGNPEETVADLERKFTWEEEPEYGYDLVKISEAEKWSVTQEELDAEKAAAEEEAAR